MNALNNSGKSADKPFSPSELNLLARKTIEDKLARVWVSGEITDYYQAPSGHSYFSLKDAQSSIKCTFFKQFNFAKKKLNNGDQLIVMGLATLYQERGNFQIKVERAQSAGKGNLAQEFEKLKIKLESMGYFSDENKKPLPTVIGDLALVTSKSSAAIQDVLNVIRRRNPLLKIKIYNTSVQGDLAVGEIINALHQADIAGHDVILLTRGGGSEEDLWTFNDVSIAQTLFNLNTPCVSAVGHEKDISISDLVADESAITPSAAAERLTPDISIIKQSLEHNKSLLSRIIKQHLLNLSQTLDYKYSKLEKSHPKIKLDQQLSNLKQIKIRMLNTINSQLTANQYKLKTTQNALLTQTLNFEKKLYDLENSKERMQYAMHLQVTQSNNHLQQQAAQLHALSPLSTLSRGYSITKDSDQKILDDVHNVRQSDTIITQLKNGEIISQVKKVSDST